MSKKDRTSSKKIGPFWYPEEFYAIQQDHLLGNAFRKHCEFTSVMESYNYMMELKTLKTKDMFAFYMKFIDVGSWTRVNAESRSFQQVIDAMNQPAARRVEPEAGRNRALGEVWPSNRRHADHQIRTPVRVRNRVMPGKVINDAKDKMVFQPVTNDVLRRLNMEIITSFWLSPIFLAVHNWRIKLFWRKWFPNSKVPSLKLSNEAYRAAMSASSKVSEEEVARKLGISVEELREMADDL